MRNTLSHIPLLLGVAVLGAVVALKLGVGSSHAAVSPTMHAFVHDDNSIGLTFDDGTLVGNQARNPPVIPPGTYTIRVVDDTAEHNFHLMGPGVDMATPTDLSASPTWTVTLQPGGTYKFQCDTHFDFMYGIFQTSGSASSSTSNTSTSATTTAKVTTTTATTTVHSGSPLRGTLAGTLSKSGVATLLNKGKAITKLAAGRYSFAITDKDAKAGFTLQALKKAPKALTGVAFVGKHTVTVTLTAGKWSFFTAGGKKRSFTVS